MVKRISCKASDFEFWVRILARAYNIYVCYTEINMNVKKIFLIIFLGILLFPSISLAYNVYQTEGDVNVIYKGIVPCGKPVNLGGSLSNGDLVGGTCCIMPCTFCHAFVMLDGAIDFVLFKLVPPIAILMLVIGGVMFMFAHFGGAEMLPGGGAGGPKMLGQAKKLITSVVIGLIIIFAAWIIIDLFFSLIGLSEFSIQAGLGPGEWSTINCSTDAQVCAGRLSEASCMGIRAEGRTPCATTHYDGTAVGPSECLE